MDSTAQALGGATVPTAASLSIQPSLSGWMWFGIGLLAIEAGLLVVAILLPLPLMGWVVAHAIILGASSWQIARRARNDGDATPLWLIVSATLIAGPLGTACAVFAVYQLSRETANQALLDAWYTRIALSGDIDPVTRLYNNVAMNRVVQTTLKPPQVFERVMLQGTLGERQNALGLIARRFVPAYAPALRLALVSDEPVIRVQAAAVAVKVRAELNGAIKRALAEAEVEGRGIAEQATLVATLHDLVHTGLLEDDDYNDGLAAVRTLHDLIAAALACSTESSTESTERAGVAGLAELSHDVRSLLESELLRRGELASFRTVRAAGLTGVSGATPHD